MGVSDRRQALRAKRKAAKEARIKGKGPAGMSKYALKRQGQHPKNSPYLTGNWGEPCRKLRAPVEIEATPPRPRHG